MCLVSHPTRGFILNIKALAAAVEEGGEETTDALAMATLARKLEVFILGR